MSGRQEEALLTVPERGEFSIGGNIYYEIHHVSKKGRVCQVLESPKNKCQILAVNGRVIGTFAKVSKPRLYDNGSYSAIIRRKGEDNTFAVIIDGEQSQWVHEITACGYNHDQEVFWYHAISRNGNEGYGFGSDRFAGWYDQASCLQFYGGRSIFKATLNGKELYVIDGKKGTELNIAGELVKERLSESPPSFAYIGVFKDKMSVVREGVCDDIWADDITNLDIFNGKCDYIAHFNTEEGTRVALVTNGEMGPKLAVIDHPVLNHNRAPYYTGTTPEGNRIFILGAQPQGERGLYNQIGKARCDLQGRFLAFQAQKSNGLWTWVVNGKENNWYPEVDEIWFHKDRYFFEAKNRQGDALFVAQGEDIGAFKTIDEPIFTKKGDYAFAAKTLGNQNAVIKNGRMLTFGKGTWLTIKKIEASGDDFLITGTLKT